MGNEERLLCDNGHEVEPGAKFCSECGSSVDPSPGGTAASETDLAPSRTPRKLNWWQVTGVFAVIGLVIYLAVLRPALNGGAEDTAEGSTPAPPQDYSAASECFNSVTWAVDTLIANRGASADAAVDQIVLEFGTNDPRFRLSLDVYSNWSREAYSNGRAIADGIKIQEIADWCQANS